AVGFKEGFAEFLYQGGDGEPPPLPPQKYRSIRYQTPEGYQAVEAWFAGYRHGAAEARKSGQRELVTGPSALRVPSPPLDPPREVAPVPGEPLPPPRKVEDLLQARYSGEETGWRVSWAGEGAQPCE